MVSGKYKSRTFRRVYRKTPGARNVIQYKTRKHGKAQCGGCGTSLPGVHTGTKTQIGRLTKSQKRPERPYGGVLCSRCTRLAITSKARQ